MERRSQSSLKDTPKSEALDLCSGQTVLVGAQHSVQSLRADDEVETNFGRSKRQRWLENEADNSTSLINFDFNRTISSSTQHLFSPGHTVPLATDAADLELSIKAAPTSAASKAVQQQYAGVDIIRSGKSGLFSAFSQSSSSARSLSPHHQNELIAKLVAAATSAASSSNNSSMVQALHRRNHEDLRKLDVLAYNGQQSKHHVGIRNHGLVSPSACISQQIGPLKNHDSMATTIITKPYDSIIKTNSSKANPFVDSSFLNTTTKTNSLDGEASKEFPNRFKKVAMQKHVKVVMEGRSIERKVCLEEYDSYESLAKALFDMYVGTLDDKHLQLNVSNVRAMNPTLQNVIPGYKIAYQDFEGDLLLAGDLPWREFTRVAKQIKILPLTKPNQQLIDP